MAYTNSSDHQDIFQYSYPAQASYGHYVSDGSIGTGDESNFWSSSPRSDSPSPNGYIQVGPYQVYKPISYTAIDHRHVPYKTEYSHLPIPAEIDSTNHIPFVRVVKRRSTANKKERRRTQSINNAYADLRDCIPNVPADTKLSKIKTLRLATSYISYLTRALETDDTVGGFKAELGSISRKTTNNLVHVNGCPSEHVPPKTDLMEDLNNSRKAKGRTGWPQHVWALELKQEQTI